MKRRKAVIAGASGLVGQFLLAHLLARGDWEVVAVSRRKPDVPGDYRHLSVDLANRSDVEGALQSITDVTHVFFAAYAPHADPVVQVATNTAMLVNLVEAVEPASPVLEHVHLVEGTKWYGSHLGPFKTPAVETDPRHGGPNFYFDQQDWLEARQRGKRWHWSAVRPHTVCGVYLGGPMNLALAIAVYAAILKELGEPLSFPGKPGAYATLYQATDASLLARAMEWMATTPACANQAFNVTNGDLIRWQNVWPKFAQFFGMEVAPPKPVALAAMMADKSTLWDRISRKHDLEPRAFADLVNWQFPDYVFATDYDIISSTTKARLAGFHDAADTEAMFLRIFAGLRQRRIIP